MFDYAGGAQDGRGERLGTCLVVKPCASCVISLQYVCMHHIRFLPKSALFMRCILVSQKGTEIVLVRKPKATRLFIKYKSTSALAIHSATLQSSLYIRLQTKLLYIYTHFCKRPKPLNHVLTAL